MLAVCAFAAIGCITTPFAQSDEDLWDNDPSKPAALLHRGPHGDDDNDEDDD